MLITIFSIYLYFIIRGILEGMHWQKPKKEYNFIFDYHGWRSLETLIVLIGFYFGRNDISINFIIQIIGHSLIANWLYQKFLDKVAFNIWFKTTQGRTHFKVFNFKIKTFWWYYEVSAMVGIITLFILRYII